jgi:hypothetical protein
MYTYAQALHSGGDRGTEYPEAFFIFLSLFSQIQLIMSQIRPFPVFSTSSPIHQIVLSFDFI